MQDYVGTIHRFLAQQVSSGKTKMTILELAIPRGLATGSIIVCVFEVSVARRFWFFAP